MVDEEKRNGVDLERKGDFYETRQNEFSAIGVPLSFLELKF